MKTRSRSQTRHEGLGSRWVASRWRSACWIARAPEKGNVSVRNSFDLLANLEVIEEGRDVTGVQTERKEVRNGVFPRATPEMKKSVVSKKKRDRKEVDTTKMTPIVDTSEMKKVKVETCDELCGLIDADLELNGVDNGVCWHHLETVMDSGAAESVAPTSMAPWIKVEESEGSRRGQTYMSASGDRLPSLGERKFDIVTESGMSATATYQVADVARALCSCIASLRQREHSDVHGDRRVYHESDGSEDSHQT